MQDNDLRKPQLNTEARCPQCNGEAVKVFADHANWIAWCEAGCITVNMEHQLDIQSITRDPPHAWTMVSLVHRR